MALDPLQTLASLETLSLGDFESPELRLVRLDHLKTIRFRDVPLASLHLERIPQLGPELALLDIDEVSLREIDTLSTLRAQLITNLQVHDKPSLKVIHGTDLGKIGLGNLPVLEKLDLHDCDLDPAELEDLTSLRELRLTGSSVADIGPLAGLTRLETLELGHTEVADLSPLAGLTNLKVLVLTRTKVADLSPLAGLERLQGLRLDDTEITDISPLRGLTKLRRLDLRGTHVSNLDPLLGLH